MRIIDADAIDWGVVEYAHGKRDETIVDCEILIELQPTIDAVEVVRCKDCTGCRFVGTYDTQFPCANCVRKTKDYYDSPQTERSE